MVAVVAAVLLAGVVAQRMTTSPPAKVVRSVQLTFTGQVAFPSLEAAFFPALATDGGRVYFTLNTLTRIRFVTAGGTLEFATKGGPDAAPAGYHAWFDAPGRRTAGTRMAFGHWSALGLFDRPDVLALDTGCVWGGKLSAARTAGSPRHGCAKAGCDRSASASRQGSD